MLIDPDAFDTCFSAWAQSFAEAFEREVVAIDGKTLRRSFDRGRTLGQREVDGKSNEITAIPALLETLSLKNCIVTLGFGDHRTWSPISPTVGYSMARRLRGE